MYELTKVAQYCLLSQLGRTEITNNGTMNSDCFWPVVLGRCADALQIPRLNTSVNDPRQGAGLSRVRCAFCITIKLRNVGQVLQIHSWNRRSSAKKTVPDAGALTEFRLIG